MRQWFRLYRVEQPDMVDAIHLARFYLSEASRSASDAMVSGEIDAQVEALYPLWQGNRIWKSKPFADEHSMNFLALSLRLWSGLDVFQPQCGRRNPMRLPCPLWTVYI